jgi:hypothetical protein
MTVMTLPHVVVRNSWDPASNMRRPGPHTSDVPARSARGNGGLPPQDRKGGQTAAGSFREFFFGDA